MKNLVTTVLTTVLFTSVGLSQASGNINYQNQVKFEQGAYHNLNHAKGITHPQKNISLTIKGLANVKADSYVAIFNVSQTGKTADEVNQLMDSRINTIENHFKAQENMEVFIDMLSFVPVYELEKEKKIFSKTTYNEVPAGFELKKNLHFKYQDPNQLNAIIAKLAEVEIYDLIRVDYFSESLEKIKEELKTKAIAMLKKKLTLYQGILDVDLDSLEKHFSDGYYTYTPIEMYKSYQVYSSSSLDLKKNNSVTQTNKSTTLFYQPLVSKGFDFVLNPIIVEPVIQITYELRLNAIEKPKPILPPVAQAPVQKEIYIITQTGELKKIPIP